MAGALAALLAGGSLLGTCQTRLKEGLVAGTESFLYGTFLDPAFIAELVLGEEAADTTE